MNKRARVTRTSIMHLHMRAYSSYRYRSRNNDYFYWRYQDAKRQRIINPLIYRSHFFLQVYISLSLSQITRYKLCLCIDYLYIVVKLIKQFILFYFKQKNYTPKTYWCIKNKRYYTIVSDCFVIKNTPLRASSTLIKAEHNYRPFLNALYIYIYMVCGIIITFDYRSNTLHFVKL